MDVNKFPFLIRPVNLIILFLSEEDKRVV